ncbi:MAG TPA: sugar ABC transporter permease [Spirochaetia bacterium]|nr:sugar ABC transporter permease [Spirochaetia bacterium]
MPADSPALSGHTRRWLGKLSGRGDTAAAYVLLAPALLLLAVWFLYPIVSSFLLSAQAVNVFHYSKRTWVGLANYRELLSDPVFRSTIRITLAFVLIVVPAQTVLALLAAVLVQSLRRLSTFYRTALFVPYVTSTVAVTAVFMDLFTVHAALPAFFSRFGLPDVSWFADVHLALPFLAMIYVWMNLGLYMVIFLSGLQTVPPELYEAARVDGARGIHELLFITIPSLRPFVLFVVIAGMIGAFQVFDQAYVVSGGTVLGGPAGATSTIVIFIFAQAFRYNMLGSASAAAVLLLAVVSVATLIMRRVFREETRAS